MSKFDGAAFGEQIVAAVKAHLQPLREALGASKAENSALGGRIEALEARMPIAGPEGPKGEKGADGLPGNDGAPGLHGKDGRNGADGKDGPPGLDGKDGVPGLDGKDGKDGAPGEPGPPGRDGQPGVPGRDGQDGLGFDDLDIEHDGERGFTFRLRRGDRQKEWSFIMPVMLYRGVWAKDGRYSRGDAVTWRGSLWVAKAETSAKPDEASSAWTLCAKKGRDGKDAGRSEGARP